VANFSIPPSVHLLLVYLDRRQDQEKSLRINERLRPSWCGRSRLGSAAIQRPAGGSRDREARRPITV
jgi:hypothetical protein